MIQFFFFLLLLLLRRLCLLWCSQRVSISDDLFHFKGCFHISDLVVVEKHLFWQTVGSSPNTNLVYQKHKARTVPSFWWEPCLQQANCFHDLTERGESTEIQLSHFWPLHLNEDSASLNVLGHFPYLWCCRSSWNSWGSGCRAHCQSCSDTPSRRWVTGGCTLFALDCWFWYMAGTENSQLKSEMMITEYKHIPEVELSHRAPATADVHVEH